jgi:hypothetical protein
MALRRHWVQLRHTQANDLPSLWHRAISDQKVGTHRILLSRVVHLVASVELLISIFPHRRPSCISCCHLSAAKLGYILSWCSLREAKRPSDQVHGHIFPSPLGCSPRDRRIKSTRPTCRTMQAPGIPSLNVAKYYYPPWPELAASRMVGTTATC